MKDKKYLGVVVYKKKNGNKVKFRTMYDTFYGKNKREVEHFMINKYISEHDIVGIGVAKIFKNNSKKDMKVLSEMKTMFNRS